jgi:hypothetical protein
MDRLYPSSEELAKIGGDRVYLLDAWEVTARAEFNVPGLIPPPVNIPRLCRGIFTE